MKSAENHRVDRNDLHDYKIKESCPLESSSGKYFRSQVEH